MTTEDKNNNTNYWKVVITTLIVSVVTVTVNDFLDINWSRIYSDNIGGVIDKAQKNETLIIVLPFQTRDVADNLPHRDIKVAIEKKLQTLRLDKNTRVEEMPERKSLRSDNKDGAQKIKDNYNARLIIWGDVTEVKTTVSFLGDGLGIRIIPELNKF